MSYFTNLLILSLFGCLSLSEGQCVCPQWVLTEKQKTCLPNLSFSGVVEITSPAESCPDTDKFKCSDIKVLESFKKTIEADSIKTVRSFSECGPSMPSSGTFIITGYSGTKEGSITLSGCNSIVIEVSGLEDPKVSEYREYANDCENEKESD